MGSALFRVTASFVAIAIIECALSVLFMLRRERQAIAVLLKKEW
jgi:cell division protein FtsL